MSRPRVLVVDDEQDILELIRYNLERDQFAVHTVTSGEAALEQLESQAPDAVVLDLMLPGIGGIEVCRRIKSAPATAALPVLMLTAKGEDVDIVNGLETGADDYVTKPFSPRILVARIRALLRRNGSTNGGPERVEVHDLIIDTSRHEVWRAGRAVHLSATEFAILEFLARNPGWVFSRARIIDAVKGKDYPVTERSVDVQILGLRKKLDDTGQLIETVRGVGYRIRGL